MKREEIDKIMLNRINKKKTENLKKFGTKFVHVHTVAQIETPSSVFI